MKFDFREGYYIVTFASNEIEFVPSCIAGGVRKIEGSNINGAKAELWESSLLIDVSERGEWST